MTINNTPSNRKTSNLVKFIQEILKKLVIMDNPGGRQTKIEHMNEYQSVKSEKKGTYNCHTIQTLMPSQPCDSFD